MNEKKKFDFNLRSRLTVSFVACGLIPLIAAAVICYMSASSGFSKVQDQAMDALRQNSTDALIAQRELKAVQLSDYFGFIQSQIQTFSEDGMVVEAMSEFRDSFKSYRTERKLKTEQEIETMRSELLSYYSGPFAENYRDMNDGKNPPSRQYLNQLDDDSIALQHAYIFSNKNQLGSKHLLDASDDSTRYSSHHEKVHPIIRDYLDKFGYYDIFLVDAETGDIVYSVFKELDYSTSLVNGPYADSNFGEAFRRANASTSRDSVVLVDFARYTPSYEAPASFIASPIYEGDKKIGIAMFQMPVDRILEIMNVRVGLGETGETILIGPDYLMRSDSYLDPEKHSLATSWKYPETGRVDTKATRAAIEKGESGTVVTTDYRGKETLIAYTPVKLGDLTYCLNAKMDTEETFASCNEMAASVNSAKAAVVRWCLGLAVIAGALVAGVAFLVSGRVAVPIRTAAAFARQIAEGNLTSQCEVNGKAEVAELARAMNDMRDNLAGLLGEVVSTSEVLNGSSTDLSETARRLSNGANDTTERASNVAAAAEEMSINMTNMAAATEQVSGNVNSVASTVEEMSSTISEIARNAEKAAGAVASAVTLAEASNQQIDTLGSSAAEIGSVIEVIEDIAEQTNLLALNATIEAARAGDAGKGFAVVATEVKELAKQTADATDDIRARIEAIQESTGVAVESIGRIGSAIKDVKDVSQTIASAVEEQGICMKEVSQNVAQAASAAETVSLGVKESAQASQEISKNINTVNQSAKESNLYADETKTAGDSLSERADTLQGALGRFQLAPTVATAHMAGASVNA